MDAAEYSDKYSYHGGGQGEKGDEVLSRTEVSESPETFHRRTQKTCHERQAQPDNGDERSEHVGPARLAITEEDKIATYGIN